MTQDQYIKLLLAELAEAVTNDDQPLREMVHREIRQIMIFDQKKAAA